METEVRSDDAGSGSTDEPAEIDVVAIVDRGHSTWFLILGFSLIVLMSFQSWLLWRADVHDSKQKKTIAALAKNQSDFLANQAKEQEFFDLVRQLIVLGNNPINAEERQRILDELAKQAQQREAERAEEAKQAPPKNRVAQTPTSVAPQGSSPGPGSGTAQPAPKPSGTTTTVSPPPPPPQRTTTTAAQTTTTRQGGLPLPTLPLLPPITLPRASISRARLVSTERKPMNLAALAAVLAVFSPLVWKAVDFFKFIRAGDVSAWATQLFAWVIGVGIAYLVWQSNLSDAAAIHSLNWASVLIGGLAMGSIGSALYDFKRAKDNTDSAETPSLLPKRARAVRKNA